MKGKWAKAVVGVIAAFAALATVAVASGDSRWAHGTFSGKTVSKYCVWVETKGHQTTKGDLKAYQAYPGMNEVCIVGKTGKTGKGAKGAAGAPALRDRRASRVTPEARDPRATRAPRELPAAPDPGRALCSTSRSMTARHLRSRTCPSPSRTRPRATRTRPSS